MSKPTKNSTDAGDATLKKDAQETLAGILLRSQTLLPTAQADNDIAEVLLRHHLISLTQLQNAREIQIRTGERLEKVLLTASVVDRETLYHVFAETWNIGFVDLLRQPPHGEFTRQFPSAEMAQDGWLPLTEEDGAIMVATRDRPTKERADRVLELYAAAGLSDANRVVFLAATDWGIQETIQALFRYNLMHDAAYGLNERSPALSAEEGLVLWQKVAVALTVGGLVTGCVLNLTLTAALLIMLLSTIFLAVVAFKVLATVLSLFYRSRFVASAASDIPDDELPLYTILVPLHKEANIVRSLISHMHNLDYPQEKLEVLLLIEESDTETIDAVQRAMPPGNIRPILIPDGLPRTKPRACNVGLFFARGEYLVIYDAEDRPEPDQLRKAVAALRSGPDHLVCVQARLNYYNPYDNLLTRLFTIEYSQWFDYMLLGLDRLRLPIPLGGTSNHFRVDRLRELDGWDAFNVAEDADLGLRASATGLSVGIISSTTFEEACERLVPWIHQRTRWTKGYIQTVVVHSRRPFAFARNAGLRGVIGFFLLIFGTPFTYLVSPILWLITAMWICGVPGLSDLESQIPDPLVFVGLLSFIVGNVAVILLNALAVERRRLWMLLPYSLLTPFYWFLHSFAAWRALFQLIRNPSVWEKTPHGLSKTSELEDSPALASVRDGS